MKDDHWESKWVEFLNERYNDTYDNDIVDRYRKSELLATFAEIVYSNAVDTAKKTGANMNETLWTFGDMAADALKQLLEIISNDKKYQ